MRCCVSTQVSGCPKADDVYPLLREDFHVDPWLERPHSVGSSGHSDEAVVSVVVAIRTADRPVSSHATPRNTRHRTRHYLTQSRLEIFVKRHIRTSYNN